MGLHQAWPDAEIIGVDIEPQPHYPFKFFQGDALLCSFSGVDFVWASPPCQGYSWTSHIHHCQQRPYPKLIEKTRKKLRECARSWVIENVMGAPLEHPVVLCGTAFGLPLRRHRQFESNFVISACGPCAHGNDYGVYAGKVTRLGTHGTSYVAGSGRTHYRPLRAPRVQGQEAMQIDWMNSREISQAIPPAYSRYIAEQWSAQP